MDAGEWISSAVAVLALVVSVLAVKFTRDQRNSARDAIRIAQDAAESSRRQADAADRSLVIVQTERDEILASRARQLVFRLSHFEGQRFSLTNTSDEDKSDVRVALPPYVVREAGDIAWGVIRAGATESFLCGRTRATPAAPKLSIVWAAPDQPVGTMREDHLLPPEA
jgi:hypothetical protein